MAASKSQLIASARNGKHPAYQHLAVMCANPQKVLNEKAAEGWEPYFVTSGGFDARGVYCTHGVVIYFRRPWRAAEVEDVEIDEVWLGEEPEL